MRPIGKYGVRNRLPDGSRNPEYWTRWNRAHGTKPRRKPGKNPYGVPRYLLNGGMNPGYMHRYNKVNAKRISEYWTQYYKVNRDRNIEQGRKWREANPLYYHDLNQRNKKVCIDHFGGECVRCGERRLSFLTLSHPDMDGAKHRKKLFGNRQEGGKKFYAWLIKNDFKTEYRLQVECWNHNLERNWTASTSASVRYWRKLKKAVIDAYGGACECCGDDTFWHLGIAHPQNDGNKHRKLQERRLGYPGYADLLRRLKEAGFPRHIDGFEIAVMCHNCNMGAQSNGGACPHIHERQNNQ